MYPDKWGKFYYSKRNYGTRCPYPGSWYDGANCYVCDIPLKDYSGNYGFIWHNGWYIKANLEL